jgi:hypothetical protein
MIGSSMMAVLSVLLAMTLPVEAVYRALRESKDAKAPAVVKQLESVRIAEVKVDRASLGEAMDEINRKGAAGKGGGVINFVIRRPRGGAGQKSLKEEPVTLDLKETNFAAAMDEACARAGYRWTVEFQPDSGVALLVIVPAES